MALDPTKVDKIIAVLNGCIDKIKKDGTIGHIPTVIPKIFNEVEERMKKK